VTKIIHPREILAEFIGSMLLVMAAVGSMIMLYVVYELPAGIALIGNALSVGFVLFSLIEIFASLSGASFNPVVTFIMTLEQNSSWKKALCYMLAQILGGLVGIMITHLKFFEHIGALFAVSSNVRNGSRYFSEIMATFILVLAILILSKINSSKIPLIVGLLVGGQILATSSAMFANPMVSIARIFTPTISGIRPIDALVFVLMQFIGGLLAYGVYKLIFLENRKEITEK